MNPLPAPDPGRALVYRRVSSADQARDGYGLDAQAVSTATFIKREGLTLEGYFADRGVSGAAPLEARPGLSEALRVGRRDGIGALVVARHDRIAREALQALLIEQAFENAGIRVLYAEGDNGEGSVSKMQRLFMHGIAEQAKAEMLIKLDAGRQAKRARNPHAYIGGRPAFGYRADPKTRELSVNPDTAPVVRDVFSRARKGQSIRQISDALNVENAGGRRWHPTSVRRVLTHGIYKRKHPGQIVDGKLWNAAQAALEGRRKREPGR